MGRVGNPTLPSELGRGSGWVSVQGDFARTRFAVAIFVLRTGDCMAD